MAPRRCRFGDIMYGEIIRSEISSQVRYVGESDDLTQNIDQFYIHFVFVRMVFFCHVGAFGFANVLD